MKLFVTLFSLAISALAAETPIPRGALLVLPQNSNATSTTTTTTTTTPPPPQADDLTDLNSRIMEQLRQQGGSDGGVYHVYLPDGRLQRVQYTTAPVSSQIAAQQVQEQSFNSAPQDPRGITITPQAVYFVQVPADRLQNLQVPLTPQGQNATQQVNQTSSQDPPAQDSPSPDVSPRSSQPSARLSTQYLPLTVVSVDQLRPLTPADSGSLLQQADTSSRQAQATGRQQQQPTSNAASIQYSEVEPIAAPIYAYSPQQLVRILRYAL